MVHIQLLGPLLVRDDQGRDLTPPRSREQMALATLAVVSPESLSTERLAGELYRERDTVDPRNAVQAVISRLRRALGQSAGVIETTTNGYRLVDITLDVDDAEERLLACLAETDPDRSRILLDEALALWHGPTMDGLVGELVDAERLRIDDLRADAEDASLDRLVSAGHDPTVIQHLEAAVRDRPLREKRWELLMLSLYRDGRQADALRAFQRARSLLSSHLGLEPGPALARLEGRILAHDPDLDPSPPSDGAGADEAGPGTPPAGPKGDTVSLPAGTVSLVLCDVEGSVRRWESAPEDTAREIAELHRVWMAATVSAGGQLVKSTGDGVMMVFETAGAAVEAAVAALTAETEGALSVRVAVSTGSLEPMVDEHGFDYRGPTVNRCARLLDLAHGGQILVSATTAELARSDLGLPRSGEAPLSLRDLGQHWLRDVPEPMTVWQVEGPGLRSGFPPLRSSGPRSLPRNRGGLLGRSTLIADVVDQVDRHTLVTLLGPGGIGKTSVAVAAAWDLADRRPVTFVDLARVTEPTAVVHRMADGISIADHDPDRDPIVRIVDRLRSATDLVVIDNAEHVLDAVASTLDAVLTTELEGSFLVTSRQPLGLPDEMMIGVPPLDLPGEDDDLDATGRSPSVRLFLDRVRANRPEATPANGLLPVVAHICRRLDGIPLAIELAAGRASLLSVDDIAARLDDQLRLLRQVRSTRDRRHRSLEAVVTWSVDQLSADGRELFDRLAVMTGSFGIDAVEQLLHHCGSPSIDALDGLDELHGASLLVVEPEGSRFRMLEPIRQVAAAELADRGLETATRRAHARWLIDVLRDADRRRDETRAKAFAAVDPDRDQLTAALTWIADNGQTDLAIEIAMPCSWWFLTRDARIGSRLLSRLVPLVDRDVDPLGWAAVIIGLSTVSAGNPTNQVAQHSLDAVAIFDEHDHPDVVQALLAAAFAQIGVEASPADPVALLAEAEARLGPQDKLMAALVDMAIMSLSRLSLSIGSTPVDPEAEEIQALVERGRRACALFRRSDETWALGVTLGELGRFHQLLGQLEAAEACFVESLDLFPDADFHGSHYVLTELGKLASARGDHARADRCHREAMRIAELDGAAACLAVSWAGLADAAVARGDSAEAVEHYRRAVDLAVEGSFVQPEAVQWREEIERLTGEAHADGSG